LLIGFVLPPLSNVQNAYAQKDVREVLQMLGAFNKLYLPEFEWDRAIELRKKSVFVYSRKQKALLSRLPCPATSSVVLSFSKRTPTIVMIPTFYAAPSRPLAIRYVSHASPATENEYRKLTCLGQKGILVPFAPRLTISLAGRRKKTVNNVNRVRERIGTTSFDGSEPKAGKRGTAIVWFRNDLRVHDNAALNEAIKNADKVIPVYCFDPRQFGKTSFGFEKTGRYRAKFLIESVQDLRATFERLGGGLVIRHGVPEEELPKLCQELKANAVYCHKEVTYEEQEVESAVQGKLKSSGVMVHMNWGNTLYHEKDLPFAVDNMPDVYTDFRRIVESGGVIRAPIEVPKRMKSLPHINDGTGQIPSLAELGLGEPMQGMSQPLSSFVGGETEAVRRLEQYLLEASQRAEAPSFTPSDPARREATLTNLVPDFSCKISPWLALGCLSPRRIYDDVKARAGLHEPKTGSVYYELVWRDFFRFITKKYGSAKMTRHARGTVDATAAIAEAVPA